MDITAHDEFEKSEKYFRNLRESYINKLSGKTEVLSEKSHYPKQGKIKNPGMKTPKAFAEENVPAQPEDETVPPAVTEPAPATDVPPVTEPAAEPVPATEPEVAPAADAPVVDETPLQADPVKVESLKNFVNGKPELVTGLAFNPETDVNAKGYLLKTISAENSNTGIGYKVLIFPADMDQTKLFADVQTVDQTGAQGASAETDAALDQEIAAAGGGDAAATEVPPVVEPAVGGDAAATEVPPVEASPEEKEDEALKEMRLDEKRDPTYSGKKDWKKMLQKILNESIKKQEVLNEETEEEINKKIANLEKRVSETTGEEQEAAKEALAAVRSRKAKLKGKEAADKGKEKPLSDAEKEKVKNTEES